MIFGANSVQTFAKITLPLAFPALAASSMYSFLTAWNDTISALILTNKNQTLSLVVYKAIGTTSSGIQYAAGGKYCTYPSGTGVHIHYQKIYRSDVGWSRIIVTIGGSL